jgi:TatD DNase family protein
MLADSHCHLNFPELRSELDQVLAHMRQSGVGRALCVCVNLEEFPEVLEIAGSHKEIYASVGVHPDYEDAAEPTVERLVEFARHPKVVAIGETGLDYYRIEGDHGWQQARFRTHIRASKACAKPLIVHTRSAARDTIKIMKEENAAQAGGVMHCFTETWEVAEAALAMNFYISFSGIVTFKNALEIKEVARKVPLERMLIETDSPYLAPVPYRGKTNRPGYVKQVAEELARLREVSLEEIASATTENFEKLFRLHEASC